MKQKITIKLSPSKIGQYYEKRCVKNLVSISLSDSDIECLGWIKEADEPSAAAMAGNVWEKEICDNLKLDPSIQFVEVTSTSKKKTQTIDDTVEILRNLNQKEYPTYIYQACVCATETFKNKYLKKHEGLLIYT